MKRSKEFSERLRQTRKAKGILAVDLANATDVTPTTVWHWERNGVLPRKKKLHQIAAILEVTPNFLLTGEDEGVVYRGPDPVEAPAEPSPRPSVADIVKRAEAEIAEVTGVSPDHVKIRVEIMPE